MHVAGIQQAQLLQRTKMRQCPISSLQLQRNRTQQEHKQVWLETCQVGTPALTKKHNEDG